MSKTADRRQGGIGPLVGALDGSGMKGGQAAELWNPPYCGDIGLAIRGDGVWSYRGSPITRQPLVKLFASVLRREADGRYYLVTPAEKVDVAVADAPFLAVEMTVEGTGREQVLRLLTNVDEAIVVGPEHPLRVAAAAGGGMKPYARVRGGLEALLTRALAFELCGLAAVHGPAIGVWSSGAFFPLAELPTV